MANSISIRKATIDDSQNISNLMIEVAREFSFPFMTAKGQRKILVSFSAKSINEYIIAGIVFWVAAHVLANQNEIVGVISIENNSHLKHLFVEGKMQGKGISTQLWEVSKSYLKQNCKAEKITVCSSPNAVELYKKWDFVQTGKIQNEEEIPFVSMEILLDNI
jgi:GNAT superfamily N-acetyltransferase